MDLGLIKFDGYITVRWDANPSRDLGLGIVEVVANPYTVTLNQISPNYCTVFNIQLIIN